LYFSAYINDKIQAFTWVVLLGAQGFNSVNSVQSVTKASARRVKLTRNHKCLFPDRQTRQQGNCPPLSGKIFPSVTQSAEEELFTLMVFLVLRRCNFVCVHQEQSKAQISPKNFVLGKATNSALL
jgi:hypothetical protein